jgi:hypothetical protein
MRRIRARTAPCLFLAVALSAGCTIVHTRPPGTADELPSLAPEAEVLRESREAIALPPQAPGKATSKPFPSTDKPKPPAAIASAPNPVRASAAAPNPAAPLDLDDLRARLKDTAAIGFMAKIELRNQVDALVDRFRTHHAGGAPSALDALRQSFNALMQKVLALIREGDPVLAALLASSREAIWDVLEDPAKFNAMK